MIKLPIEIIMHACSFISYWSDLYNSEYQSRLAHSIKVMMGVAYKLLAQQVASRARAPPPPKEEDVLTDEDENEDMKES